MQIRQEIQIITFYDFSWRKLDTCIVSGNNISYKIKLQQAKRLLHVTSLLRSTRHPAAWITIFLGTYIYTYDIKLSIF